jgi:hypothetical protein
MQPDRDLEMCEFYPTPEEDEYCGGVCGAGSDIGGTVRGGKICSKQYAEMCQWANENRDESCGWRKRANVEVAK